MKYCMICVWLKDTVRKTILTEKCNLELLMMVVIVARFTVLEYFASFLVVMFLGSEVSMTSTHAESNF